MAKIIGQKLISLKPSNNIVSGFNNNVLSNMIFIIGVNNAASTPYSSIIGKSNTIIGDNESNSILGDDNLLTGGNNVVSGKNNTVISNNTLLNGSGNFIESDENTILGNNNITISEELINKSLMIGDNNYSNSSVKIIGNYNNIKGASSSYILGSNNTLLNGLIIADNSGTVSWNYNTITTSDNIYINGNYNSVGTSSNNIRINGNNNIISASLSNVNIFGNNITATQSDKFIIKSDVVIDGKVMPTDLIQDYTPINASDPYAPKGAMVKDDNNLYIRTTNAGWKSIDLNNAYGRFYNTATQLNLTASTINYAVMDTTAYTSNVFLSNNSKINVIYDGIYNINFNLQINKIGIGLNDIDVWLLYNGIDIPFSNNSISLLNINDKAVISYNLIQQMTASSFIQIGWSSTNTNIQLFSVGTASLPTRPAIPSVNLIINKIG